MAALLEVRDVILYAVRGEKASFAAYTLAAARAGDPDVAGMLNRLARDELRHLMTLLRRFGPRYPDLLDVVDLTMPEPDSAHVESLSRASSVREVLGVAVAAERLSFAAYVQLASTVRAGARSTLQAILRRERRHVNLLERCLRAVDTVMLPDHRSAH
jgi:rubrerythrin